MASAHLLPGPAIIVLSTCFSNTFFSVGTLDEDYLSQPFCIILRRNMMLRRKPTAIQLTAEDLITYEDRKDNPGRQENASTRQNIGADGKPVIDPNDELKPLPGDRTRVPRVQTREERIGLGR